MADPMAMAGRHVLVTGASHGIGRAVAAQCVALGARVTLAGRNAGTLADAVQFLGGDAVAHAVAGDVADPDFGAQLVDTALARFGRIHGLVNNAGLSEPAMLDKLDRSMWDRVLATNLSGSFHVMQAFGVQALQAYAADGLQSSIVNVSSDAGRRGTIGQANYAASKSGVMGLTMCAAREWGRYGVRANSVCFGVVETRMTETVRSDRFRERYLAQIPLARFATPEEVAPAVCYLLSCASSYVTGQHLSVNGGLHIGF